MARGIPAQRVTIATRSGTIAARLGLATLALDYSWTYGAGVCRRHSVSRARGLGPPVALLRSAHGGVGEYLLWIAAGTAVVGGVRAVVLR